MPKNVKAKRPAPKKNTAAPKGKAKIKARAKPKPKVVASAPPPAGSFMWKLLEKKQAEIKRREQAQKDRGYGESPSHLHDVASVARFNGPRRKAA